ncbi:MAG: hypothetical protein AB2689_25840 [Candidatus Thiodiazotropha taylori]
MDTVQTPHHPRTRKRNQNTVILSKCLRFFIFFTVLVSASIYANSKSENDDSCKFCLTTDSDVHQMGSYWGVCQKGTAVCWKFKPEYRDLLLKSMNNAPKGVKFNSKSFQKKMIDIKQDEWGNKEMFDRNGSVIATADYGKSFQVSNIQKGYQEKAKQCNDSMYESVMLDVVNVGPENIKSVPKKYEWIAKQIVMVRAGEAEVDASGIISGENCDVVTSVAHAYIEHRNLKDEITGEVIRKAGDWHSSYYYAVPNMLREKETFKYLNSIETGWDNGTEKGFFRIGDARQDWSVAVSEKPILDSCVNFEIEEDGTCEGKLFLISYQPGDYHNKKYSGDEDCWISQYKPGELEQEFGLGDGDNVKLFKHGCDANPLSSGGSLFCEKENDKITWVGINSGELFKNLDKHRIYSKNSAPAYNEKSHYNKAVYIKGKFLQVYESQLRKSKDRRRKR